jgi:hypothetical protein
MDEAELQLQDKVLIVFKELNDEVTKISSKLNGLGWAAKSAYREYVNSDYQNPEKYEEADLAWRKANSHADLLKWFIQLLDTHKGSKGYFPNYNQFIKELDAGIATALNLNSLEKANILIFWRGKLPIPDDLGTRVYKFLPIRTYVKTARDYLVEFQKQFENYSDKELLDAFNGQVNNSGAVTAAMSYRAALRHEFIRRGYDYSAIGDSTSLSFSDKITFVNRTIIKINPGEIDQPGH